MNIPSSNVENTMADFFQREKLVKRSYDPLTPDEIRVYCENPQKYQKDLLFMDRLSSDREAMELVMEEHEKREATGFKQKRKRWSIGVDRKEAKSKAKGKSYNFSDENVQDGFFQITEIPNPNGNKEYLLSGSIEMKKENIILEALYLPNEEEITEFEKEDNFFTFQGISLKEIIELEKISYEVSPL